MNAMKMPGFAAEASLYEANRRYRPRASWAGMTRVYVGPAQQFLPIPPGGDPGEEPQFCKPTFGPCNRDENSPTGCSQCFTRGDCSEVCDIPCACPPPPQPSCCAPGCRVC
jgi:hypothetical protein